MYHTWPIMKISWKCVISVMLLRDKHTHTIKKTQKNILYPNGDSEPFKIYQCCLVMSDPFWNFHEDQTDRQTSVIAWQRGRQTSKIRGSSPLEKLIPQVVGRCFFHHLVRMFLQQRDSWPPYLHSGCYDSTKMWSSNLIRRNSTFFFINGYVWSGNRRPFAIHNLCSTLEKKNWYKINE